MDLSEKLWLICGVSLQPLIDVNCLLPPFIVFDDLIRKAMWLTRGGGFSATINTCKSFVAAINCSHQLNHCSHVIKDTYVRGVGCRV